jgi:ATP-dependent exoDNAse (exonuclease V) alpha subunit
MTRLYLVPSHRDATPPPPSANALMNARIVAAMNDTDIARTVARLCERMDADERRESIEAARLRLRAEMQRQLREVRTKLQMPRFAHARHQLMREQERLRTALADD